MLNTNKIKGRMKELGIVQADVAKRLELAEPTVSQKINGKRPMDLNEARALADMLHIGNEDFGAYFFFYVSCVAQQRGSRPCGR